MPKHKRESLIYTVMMCFVMVLWMSVYNVTLHMGQFGVETLKEAWLGFPVAYIFAMCLTGLSYQVRRKHSHSGFWLNRTAVCFKRRSLFPAVW